ncbi:MAG TPA: glycosyltransferase family 1 protein [Actinomycetota bacterium]|nr:glycosyltransferase family 1 protein [Actinomycetota bacterium]
MGQSGAVEQRLRVAMTLEQCWHRVPGGTAVAALEIARALRLGDDVEPIGVAARHKHPAPQPWTPPIDVRHLPLPRLALYESWHRLRMPKVERATGRVDVIHATTVAMPPRSAPIVVTVHDIAFRRDPSHFTRRGLSFFERGLELAVQDADLILCSSRATLGELRSLGVGSERLRHVPLGVRAPEVDDALVQRVRRAYGLERPYLLWVGTVEPRKNLSRLIEAYRSLGRDDVDLAAAGPKGWNEDIESLLGKAGGRIKSLGFVPEDVKAALYKGAEAFCFPSLREGFGFPVLEAMAQGTPVVTSKGTSTEELADGAGILVDPTDTGSIAQGIKQALEDEAVRRELRRRGPQRAAQYTWEHTAALVAQAYREVAS